MRRACMTTLVALAACGPDSPSSGACKDSLLAGDLVITEVMADFAPPDGGTGADEGKEWFEIFNNTDRPVSLKGVTVTHSRPDGSMGKTHTMSDITIAPGQYFTLGNSTPDLVPPYIDYGYAADLGDLYNTNGGMLKLSCGDSEIDSAIYEMVRSGRTRQLTNQSPPDYTLNDDPAAWCEASDAEFETNNFGTPGQDNDCAPVVMGVCNDGGTSRAIVPPAAGQLVITEVMPSPLGTDSLEEWFEAKALASFDLNGLGIGRVSDTTPEIVASPDCIQITSGSNVLFAHNTDMMMNGGLPAGAVRATFTTSLTSGSMTSPGDIQLSYNGAVIDAVTWTSSRNGRSLALDPDLTNATANDDSTNFCDGSVTYGSGGMGSPNADNAQCTFLPPAGMCDDNGTLRAIVKPGAGALVITEFLANPAGTGTDATQEWFEIKNTSGSAFDLNELGMQGGSTTVSTIQSASCKSVAAGAYALFAHSIDPAVNGGLPAVDVTFTFALGSRIQFLDGATVLDTVTFGSTSDGLSKQLQPGMTDTVSNDTATNFCNAQTNAAVSQQYGAPLLNYGTPKAVNVCP